MKRPIQRFDVCKIISGINGHASPNIGKEVIVGKIIGENRSGKVVEGYGKGLIEVDPVTLYRVSERATFQVNWLERIEEKSEFNNRKHKESTKNGNNLRP